MGGGTGGDIASGIVAQTIPESLVEFLNSPGGRSDIDEQAVMRTIITRANTMVWMRQVENSSQDRMGTTVVAAMVRDNVLTIGNVGDSRAYLLREGKLRQLTDDHSEVWEQVKLGNMTRDQARVSRHRNAITRAIGLSADVTPDVDLIEMQAGDTVLLCSDGLSTEISDNQIARILAAEETADSACDGLVNAALNAGGRDNITVVVLRYGPFVPMVVPESSTPPDDRDEEDTDDDPVTGHGVRSAETTVASIYDPPSPEPEADEEEPDFRRRRRRSQPNVAAAVASVLFVLLIAAGAWIYLLLTGRKETPVKPPGEPVAVKSLPAPHLAYGKAAVVARRRLREQPLLQESDGSLMAVGGDGAVLTVTPGGSIRQFEGSPIGATPGASHGNIYFALDAQQNRYQTDPVRKCIDKFSPDGVRIASDIGKGSLKAPGAIAVSLDGASIYVIDDHILKRIPATDGHS
jgi:protein phosphatase